MNQSGDEKFHGKNTLKIPTGTGRTNKQIRDKMLFQI